jgi:hypothetical protein
MERCWINQPSTLQLCHKWHGVLAHVEKGNSKIVDIYLLNKNILSMRVPRKILSKGWPLHLQNKM